MDINRQEILDFVNARAGVSDVSMHWVREKYAPNRKKRSKPLCREIRDWLKAQNVRSLDDNFPADETARIVLYRTDSPIGLAIRAARMEAGFSAPAGAAPVLRATADQLPPLSAS
jgi:hypothetical protein